MNLDKEILRVLSEAGAQGLKIEKIARHVYNSCNSMFTPLNYEDVHSYVTSYLRSHSKKPDSIVEKAEWGVYRINLWAKESQQLMLQFSNKQEITPAEPKDEDKSLSLF